MSKIIDLYWPSEKVDDFVQFVGLVLGGVATSRIDAKSSIRVFIYKTKFEDPEVTVLKDSVL